MLKFLKKEIVRIYTTKASILNFPEHENPGTPKVFKEEELTQNDISLGVPPTFFI